MMKVLVAEDEQDSRDLLVGALAEAGYAVIEAEDGGMAFEKACEERPDLILLDVMMPVMDGFEVLSRLRSLEREDPLVAAIPVILLSALSAAEGEQTAIRLGAQHYITKPWDPNLLELAVKVTLRESEATDAPDPGCAASNPSEGRMAINATTTQMAQVTSSTKTQGSLTLIEGASSSSKSVLCQHFAHQSLLDGHSVAYFTSEHSADALIAQMSSLGMKVSDYVQSGKLRISPLIEPRHGEDPGRLITLLADDVRRLSGQYEFIIIDSITELVSYSQDSAITAFLADCKRLCGGGRSIFLVVHSNAIDSKVMSDTHFSLRTEWNQAKLWKMLEVRKVRNAEIGPSNVVSFEVVPGLGMQTAPFHRVKV